MVFSKKEKRRKKEYILSRQGSSLFSNQSSRKRRQEEVEVVGETVKKSGVGKARLFVELCLASLLAFVLSHV